MNAGNLQKKLTFKQKVVSKVEKFNRKHKRLFFLGIAYALSMIFCYNVLFYFYRNAKRFTSLACIVLFFATSSSFAYPTMSVGISFATQVNTPVNDSLSSEAVSDTVISDTVVTESDARLAVIEDVDTSLIEEAKDSENPDVAEAEHLDPQKQASLDDILNATGDDSYEEEDSDSTVDTESGTTEFNSDDWKLILVNKQHPIPDDYEFHLGTISGNLRCDERIITPLLDMMKAARKDGVSLIICSPYRDMDRQTMLFNNKVKRYMESGMSYMDAFNLASQAVTVPGASEHQIGLAIDIISDGYSSLDEGFGNTAAGKWLAANSYKYGFILRYPKGKEDITSIEFEPWHFRYVGVDAATFISENDICLEEFWSIYVK
ncbi:M15 family metallopeptidase [Butyrivibrio sp. AE3009]|uniref:M15 family metallopeptidase n=1 Tax=Butyrivibrio sp. AE3009 TaxID=1280666 RepID=UPI0003B69251|nr:M15 family metallopeptidase [Butyrivibrio sp. AE3009]